MIKTKFLYYIDLWCSKGSQGRPPTAGQWVSPARSRSINQSVNHSFYLPVSQSVSHFISQSNIRSVHKPCGRSVIPSRLISLQPTRAIINLSSFQSWIVVNRWLPYFEIHLADACMYLTDKTCSRFDRPNPYKLKHRQRKSHEWRDKQEFVLS